MCSSPVAAGRTCPASMAHQPPCGGDSGAGGRRAYGNASGGQHSRLWIGKASSIGQRVSSMARLHLPKRVEIKSDLLAREKGPSGCSSLMPMMYRWGSTSTAPHVPKFASRCRPWTRFASGAHEDDPDSDQRNWSRIAGMIVRTFARTATPRHSDVHSAQATPEALEGQAGTSSRRPQG
jgi:hypothetical protein